MSMHPSLLKLTELAAKEERTVIGLMSGTSMDGLDIALCGIRGGGRKTEFTLKRFVSVPYDEEARARLLQLTSADQTDTQELCI